MMNDRATTWLVVALLIFLQGCAGSESPLGLLERVIPTSTPNVATVRVTNYCPASDRRFVTLFAVNLNAEMYMGSFAVDFDNDGVPNVRDANADLGTSPFSPDTNHDGYSDLIVSRLGLPLIAQSAFPTCSDSSDADHDGLAYCEEMLLGTDPDSPDSDGDGIPDGLELRFGLDPQDSADAAMDPDGDGVTNVQEVQMGTNPLEFNTPEIQAEAMKYVIQPVGGTTSGCVDFTISSFPIAPVPNGNLFMISVLEQDKFSTNGQPLKTYLQNGRKNISSHTAAGSVIDLNFLQIKDAD
jgi:hypothetical protein